MVKFGSASTHSGHATRPRDVCSRESIRTQGLLEKITLADGKIIDGFRRDEGCYAAHVELQYEELAYTQNKVDFVISMNFDFRQLTASQIGLLMARTAQMGHGGSRRQAGRKKDVEDSEKNQDVNLHLDSFF